MQQVKTVEYPVFKLKPYPQNPRIHDKLIEPLTKVILKYGFRVPVLIKSDGSLIDGHARLTVAKRIGLSTIPAIICDDLTEEEIKALRIGVNEVATKGEWDIDKLQSEFEVLATKYDLNELKDMTAFDPDILDDLIPKEELELADGREDSVILRYTNDVQFPTVGPLELPRLEGTHWYEGPRMQAWIGPESEPSDCHLYLFSTDSAVGINWQKTVIGFYVADQKTARLWHNTAAIVERFRANAIAGVISPDFSIFETMPLPVRLMSMYQSLWCAAYFERAGLPIVINVCSSWREIEHFLAALPEHAPLARQIQGKLNKKEVEYERIILRHIAQFQPQRLILYAPDKVLPKFEKELSEINVEVVTPRLWVRKTKYGF